MSTESPPTPGGAGPVKDADIIKAFKVINEDLHGKPELVDKCLSICHQFSVGATDLAFEWEAHALNGAPGSDASQVLLTLSSLEALEAAIGRKKAAAAHSTALSTRKLATPHTTSRPVQPFSSSSVPTSEKELRKRLSMDGGASEGGLMSPPPTDHKRPAPSAGTFLSPSESDRVARVGMSDISPATMQSPPEPASCYKSRGNAGQRTSELNAKLGARGDFTPSKRRGGSRCDITFLEDDDINLTGRYRFMYTTLEERARALERILVRLEGDMVERANLGGMEVSAVGVPRQESVLNIGRVCCEAAEGKLNKSSLVLEGSRRDSGGFRIKLELGDMVLQQGFALFPGQVIAVEGINSSGYKMVVRRICEGIPRPLMQTPVSKIRQYQHDLVFQGGSALSVMVAAGPFTTSDSLEYEPLEDLLRVVVARKPDVCVLAGPFVDANHPSIASGEAEVRADDNDDGSAMVVNEAVYETVDFEALFKMRVSYLLDSLFASNPTLPTKIILVPAVTDVFHDYVFPQPPLADRIPGGAPSPFFEEERIGNLDIPYTDPHSPGGQRVWCLSNPAIFRVNEVTFGITTNDVLFHLSGEEVSQGNAMNRLSRLAGHLIQQQSFYPLFPPPPEGQAQLDLRHADHWRMPVTPDVLLLPSKLHHFAKEVGGCLCLNPGPLTKGAVGGTYACMDIHPLPLESLEQMDGEALLEHKVASRTAVEIFKV